ncbi:hypothetical protein HanXRQr2_Chr16g0726611 [Helianthus annuus]|uniref:Uncharacterized protein n=1 Tax=Helianthus annuus TaxID=4232 RepID=A0A9K3DMV5_HELAN|nr:hypothetical protein HanXRQr2_Chr16g0726611 [Helianthus annuus]
MFRHHHHGRWQGWIGRIAGNKDLYLGKFIFSIRLAGTMTAIVEDFLGACAGTFILV